jgi:hypothetical protein
MRLGLLGLIAFYQLGCPTVAPLVFRFPWNRMDAMMSYAQRGVISALLVLVPLGRANAQVRPATAPEMPPDSFITVNGVRLQYLDWGGTGEAFLFLTSLGELPVIFSPSQLTLQTASTFSVSHAGDKGNQRSR